ncbi:hypothetical protein F0L68_09225 [Solihabitans fulvus]|uniref:TrbL/VirB6 plasmid conjugal transfer protein n=1 Tax=Solihabitans fulvus TaxID=1892852 RepID=A0A5B2XLP8_9PSEU|nr:hypothetical protein [Solihabitans fulvus]KAA2263839.1 hypothetical protein F0L68_09225 [Solihabitans fulvus]
MNLTVLVVIAAVLLAARRRRKRLGRPANRKLRTVFAVAFLLGLQAFMGVPAQAAACGEAPNPERPGSGMVGALDPPIGNGLPGSPYLDYGYAGMVWHVYDDNCVLSKSVTDPNAVIDSWAGNELFNLGKNIVGATNALHYTVMGRGLLVPLDDAVKSGVQKVYDNVYLRWFGLVALVLAVLIFRHIWTGDLASISRRGMWVLAAMWLASATLALPQFYSLLDSTLVNKTSDIQAGFLDSSADQDKTQVLPTMLHDNVVYQSWLRGEFGTPDAQQAKDFGKPLLNAQAWTTAELAQHKDGDQAALDAKKAQYKDISTKLGPTSGYFKGTDGSRTGAGFLALLQALAFSLFQLFAKAAVLLAQLLLRILTLAGPLIGLVALLHQDLLRKVGRAAAVTVFNVLILAVLAGTHALLLQAIFGASGLSLLTRTLLGLMLTLVFFIIGRPGKRMWQMVEMSVGSASSALPSGQGMFSRLRGKKPQAAITPQDEFWEHLRDTDVDNEPDSPRRGGTRRRTRPEAANPVAATAQRLDRGVPDGSLAAVAGYNAGHAALPAGSPGGYQGNSAALPSAGSSRLVDTPPVVDRSWDRTDEGVLVPSKVVDGTSRPGDNPMVPGPRRAETEVVAGRQVHVIYRPSRGFEVRDNGSSPLSYD